MVHIDDTVIRYPGTNVEMEPGDIIYSSKGLSTFLVGHAGIVGWDCNIHHAHPLGGFSESLRVYLSRHPFGSTITVFSPRVGAREAAAWAIENIQQMNRYVFHPWLNNRKYNYCTKFIWQAFWYTGTGDITGRGLSDNKFAWILPTNITRSKNFIQKTSFTIPKQRKI